MNFNSRIPVVFLRAILRGVVKTYGYQWFRVKDFERIAWKTLKWIPQYINIEGSDLVNVILDDFVRQGWVGSVDDGWYQVLEYGFKAGVLHSGFFYYICIGRTYEREE